MLIAPFTRIVSFSFVAILFPSGFESLRAADPPNILILIADDLGWRDVGYHGSEIKTPTLDKLATNGVKLERHYVYPTCSPTRCGLLTGRNPSRIRIWQNNRPPTLMSTSASIGDR